MTGLSSKLTGLAGLGPDDKDPWGDAGKPKADPWGDAGKPKADPWGDAGKPKADPWGDGDKPKADPWGDAGQPKGDPWGDNAAATASATGVAAVGMTKGVSSWREDRAERQRQQDLQQRGPAQPGLGRSR